MKKVGQLYQIGAYAETSGSFSEAYPVRDNGLFLQQYGKCLAMEEKYPQAIDVLTQATNFYNDEFTGIALGNCYQSIGDYDSDEKK